jgi:hypothetical protein
MTPITPLELGVEMFERGKQQSLFVGAVSARTSLERPMSTISDTFTDIEDDSSEFEEYSVGSVSCTVKIDSIDELMSNRMKIAKVKPRYRPSKKYKLPGMKLGPSLRSGICQSQ